MENSEIDSIRRSALIWRSIGVGAISFNLFVSVVAIIRTMDTLKQEPAREVVKAPAPPSPTDRIDIRDEEGRVRVQIGNIGKRMFGVAIGKPNGEISFAVGVSEFVSMLELQHPASQSQFAFGGTEGGEIEVKARVKGRDVRIPTP